MSRHRYLAYGLITGELITELPLTGVSYGRVLNGAGSFSATLRMPAPTATTELWIDTFEDTFEDTFDTLLTVPAETRASILAADYITGTNPARTVIYVERDGVIIDGYIVWDRTYDSETRTLSLAGAGLWSYFRRRRILFDYSVNVDQLLHAQYLVYAIQAGYPGGDIGVEVGAETSGVLRTYSWTAQQAKPLAEAIEDIADNYPGFDFSIDVAYESDVPVRRFRCWYPRKGRTTAFTGHVFELGRNIVSLTWPESGRRTANSVIAQGAGTGATMITATAVDVGQIDAGFPLLEHTVSHKDVTVQSTLAGHAQGALGDIRTIAVLPKLVVRGDLDPVIGSFTEGDDCRIRAQPGQDPRWPDGLEKYTRITAWEVDVPDEGGPENVTLTVQEVAA